MALRYQSTIENLLKTCIAKDGGDSGCARDDIFLVDKLIAGAFRDILHHGLNGLVFVGDTVGGCCILGKGDASHQGEEE